MNEPIVKQDGFGRWRLDPLPGNSQVAVSNDVFIEPEHRRKGIGEKQHRERLITAWHADCKYIICTVRADNKAEIHILAKNGWKVIDKFVTCNQEEIQIWGRRTGYYDYEDIDSKKSPE